jgi:hypothetical protein
VAAALPDAGALILELAQLRYERVLSHVRHIKEKPNQQTRRRALALKSEDDDERLAAAIVGK